MTDYLRSWALDDIIIRSGGDGRTVEAYAAMFDTPYEVRDQHGHYLEVIERSAFNRTLKNGGASRVACLYNHGMTLHGTPDALASVPLGTPLEVKADTRGLWTVTRYNRSALADATLEAIRAGDIRSQSFRGRIYRSTPTKLPRTVRRADAGLPTVVRHELGLSDYGPTPIPVNAGAEILAVRSAGDILDALDDLDDDERAALLDELARHYPGRHRQASHGNRYGRGHGGARELIKKGRSKADDERRKGTDDVSADDEVEIAADDHTGNRRRDGAAGRKGRITSLDGNTAHIDYEDGSSGTEDKRNLRVTRPADELADEDARRQDAEDAAHRERVDKLRKDRAERDRPATTANTPDAVMADLAAALQDLPGGSRKLGDTTPAASAASIAESLREGRMTAHGAADLLDAMAGLSDRGNSNDVGPIITAAAARMRSMPDTPRRAPSTRRPAAPASGKVDGPPEDRPAHGADGARLAEGNAVTLDGSAESWEVARVYPDGRQVAIVTGDSARRVVDAGKLRQANAPSAVARPARLTAPGQGTNAQGETTFQTDKGGTISQAEAAAVMFGGGPEAKPRTFTSQDVLDVLGDKKGRVGEHLRTLKDAGATHDQAVKILRDLHVKVDADPNAGRDGAYTTNSHEYVDFTGRHGGMGEGSGRVLRDRVQADQRAAAEAKRREALKAATPGAVARLLGEDGQPPLVTSKPVRAVVEGMRDRGWSITSADGHGGYGWSSPDGTAELQMSTINGVKLRDERHNAISGKKALERVTGGSAAPSSPMAAKPAAPPARTAAPSAAKTSAEGDRAAAEPAPKPPVEIPQRADGKARRGDVMIVEDIAHTSYLSSSGKAGREETKHYRAYEVSSVSRDGQPLKVRDLASGSREVTVKNVQHLRTGRKSYIPGDEVDTAGLAAALTAHTYPGSTSPMPHKSLKAIGDAIRPNLAASGATPRPAPANLAEQWEKVSKRIRGAGDVNAQVAQLNKELGSPDLLPETRTKLEKIKTDNADRIAAAAAPVDTPTPPVPVDTPPASPTPTGPAAWATAHPDIPGSVARLLSTPAGRRELAKEYGSVSAADFHELPEQKRREVLAVLGQIANGNDTRAGTAGGVKYSGPASYVTAARGDLRRLSAPYTPPAKQADPVTSRVDSIKAGGDLDDALKGATRDELMAIGREFGAVKMVDEIAKGAKLGYARKYLASEIREVRATRERQARKAAAPAAPTGALGSMSAEDQQRIRNAVADRGPEIFNSPMVGGSRSDVARYLAEGQLGKDLSGRHDWREVLAAARQVIDENPALVERSPQTAKFDAEARTARIDGIVDQAQQALKANDLARVAALLDEAHAIDPDHRLPGVGGSRSLGRRLSEIREAIRERLGATATRSTRADPLGDYITATLALAGLGAEDSATPGHSGRLAIRRAVLRAEMIQRGIR